ncbi:mandelate racemase/muconate lactonizing enzyme family protein [Microlunatus flavus]|uniref:L-alanine-DL-glutamate epimerase n=1 Tax=Microlunatus flavus TaxID=1036181 RepID=A0A1H9G612_9ACTN|nr:mandelate racemase/muconate lactonizing enzyme family protein [Microlunatus flavus]SEQ45450.1 L-alanine-DL-glutamate epimerase [Microlunatus flavus]
MRITGIDVHAYAVGYVHGTYVMSGGRAATHEDGTLVSLRTDEGLVGWGEVTTLGRTYLPTSPGTIRAALAELAPALLGLDPTNPRRLNQVMDATLLGQPYAKSAVDMACWDLFGRAVDRPVADLLGGVLTERWPLYEAVPLGEPAAMADFVTSRRAAGIERFQLKVGNEPGTDVARTRACVEAGGPSTVVVADANGGWDLASARSAVRGLGELPGAPVYVEQPCRSTADCALALRGSALPLVLDESVSTLADLVAAKHEAGAVSVNLKISRVGGLTRTALLRDAMQELGLRVSVEDMWGGDVVTAAVSHLAASTASGSLFMTSFFNDWTDGHVAGHRPRSVDGHGSLPDGPGLGVTVDAERLGAPVFSLSA